MQLAVNFWAISFCSFPVIPWSSISPTSFAHSNFKTIFLFPSPVRISKCKNYYLGKYTLLTRILCHEMSCQASPIVKSHLVNLKINCSLVTCNTTLILSSHKQTLNQSVQHSSILVKVRHALNFSILSHLIYNKYATDVVHLSCNVVVPLFSPIQSMVRYR